MAHLTPVGRDHIGRRRQTGGAAELRHHFTTGEALLSAAWIFRIGQRSLQIFTNLDRFIQRPRAVRIQSYARLREALRQRDDRFRLLFPGQHAAFQFKVVKAIFLIRRFRQAHHRIRGHRFIMTQAIPVAFVIGLALIRQRRGFTVADEEQVAEHFHFAALLAIAQQRRHVHAQMLAQQVKHRRFDPGHYVNCGTQIEGLQTAPTGVAVGESIAHGGQHVFVLTQRLTDYQRDRIFESLADFLSAGDFADAGMAGIIFNHHDITREERGVRAAQVHQHAVVARDRNDLHRRNNGGRKLCAHS